jgi:hypothetical protein
MPTRHSPLHFGLLPTSYAQVIDTSAFRMVASLPLCRSALDDAGGSIFFEEDIDPVSEKRQSRWGIRPAPDRST